MSPLSLVPLNERRSEVVIQAFDSLDQAQQGVLPAAQLRQLYDASKSWDVQQGRRTVAEAQKELSCFLEGDVTKDDWLDYYSDVSALIDDDRDFELGVRGVWRL